MKDLKSQILDELINKLSDRRKEIEIHIKDTRDERLSEIGWIEWFIYRKLNDLDEFGDKKLKKNNFKK